ncbi:hypothetical protein K443DRAFT_613495 [Laccaria amethystina LaAM-08-1]|uniref:Uncharacterized protein n=1 Tax=Laccaria amethystina LaAM-08-1 TaxID=1095629 RepID=A0A0C9WQ43_9AGAR|nr:hypothetical protein K443DRAFT_613495 [Laccaria amethystina LaAM-08-1]
MRIRYCAEHHGALGFHAPLTHQVIFCCRENLKKATVCPFDIHLNCLSPFVGLFFVQTSWEAPSVLNEVPWRRMAVLMSMAFSSVVAFSH